MPYQTLHPFPFYALPPVLRDAIAEVQTNVQAPIEIAVASALGALSLTCQDQIDVRRPNGLESPVSLYLVTLAASGERKTACDKLFTKPIQEMEAKAEIAAEIEREQYEADMLAWAVQTKALEQTILKLKRKESKNADEVQG